jgi:15-cis-phytoene synthase
MTSVALSVDEAFDRCESITRTEARNFYYGIRLLRPRKRAALCAVYALARRIDDIGDGELPTPDKLAALAQLRAEIAGLRDRGGHDGADPVLTAVADLAQRSALPLGAFEELVDGVEMDVNGRRYETFDELVGYCRCVAGSVGRLCLAIFCDGGAAALNGAHALADDLGVAMQLTNILRDVREDRERGRVYLPAEDLERFGCDELIDGTVQTTALIRFEAARAAEWFDRGMQLIDLLDARSAACVLAMTGIYRSILERIVREPAEVLERRISLPAWEKTWVAVRSLAAARPTGALG